MTSVEKVQNEIVEELSQQLDTEESDDSKITESTLLESLESESPENVDTSASVDKENKPPGASGGNHRKALASFKNTHRIL